jgi:hypothetical protein
MKKLLLTILVAYCAGFNNEQQLVDVIVAVKHYFSSGCVYILHDAEHGECHWRQKTSYDACDLIRKFLIVHRMFKRYWLK